MGRILKLSSGIVIGALLWQEHNNMSYWVRCRYWEWKILERKDFDKPKLVILGSGWASTSLMQYLLPGFFQVTVISPQNYFVFTPLLAACSVGTVEPRSIVEPIRWILKRCGAQYILAEAVDVNMDDNIVFCKAPNGADLSVEYDYLVLAVGSQVNTFNLSGVDENALKLKSISNARQIRKRIIENFEAASVPGQTEETKQRLLTNVIVGGGPTGVEFAAELCDLIKEDFVKLYSQELISKTKIILIQSADHILNSFDLKISLYAEQQFARADVDVITNAKVLEVMSDKVIYQDKFTKLNHEIPNSLCIWATGIKMAPLIRTIIKGISGDQVGQSLHVDNWMNLVDTRRENVFALGDCANIKLPSIYSYLNNKLPIGMMVNLRVLEHLTKDIEMENPLLKLHMVYLLRLFKSHARDGRLTREEIMNLLFAVESTLRSLPATAQVARQEAIYLARLFNAIGRANFMSKPMDYKKSIPPFIYRHFGMTAYVGTGHAILDLNKFWFADNFLAFWLWRSLFLSEQISYRTRLMIAFDWLKTRIFGRDISLIP